MNQTTTHPPRAKFLVSSPEVGLCPKPDRPEFAFIGRSNVGKSSLINMLMQQKHLAKTSSTPGKTQLINHFNVDDAWYLVDLPGYGFAKVPKTERKRFTEMISHYVTQRENLICLFVLIDARHLPQQIDLEFMEWLGTEGVPFAMVFTKMDKLRPSERTTAIEAYNTKMLEGWESLPPQFLTSAEKGDGRDELVGYIRGLAEGMSGKFVR